SFGMFAAGWLGDWAFRRQVRGRMTVAWIGMATVIPFLLVALAAPRGDVTSCVFRLLPSCVLMSSYYGTVYATIQDDIDPSMRGTAMSIYFCAMYCLGGVLGPVAIG